MASQRPVSIILILSSSFHLTPQSSAHHGGPRSEAGAVPPPGALDKGTGSSEGRDGRDGRGEWERELKSGPQRAWVWFESLLKVSRGVLSHVARQWV
jgi:hypothetical protein